MFERESCDRLVRVSGEKEALLETVLHSDALCTRG